jgi:hypothetical protein
MSRERHVTHDHSHAIVTLLDDGSERGVRLSTVRALEIGEEDDRRCAALHARGRRDFVADHIREISSAGEENESDDGEA